jgi:ADP-heptose:LPS heptosyltransferase
MGDVALVAPVIKALIKQYPDVEPVIVTRSAFAPFFRTKEGVELFTPRFKERHKGFTGILRLFKDLKSTGKFDHVIDLHDVLRSKVLRFLFRISGTPVRVIDKGRNEKKLVITGSRREPLKHTVERYFEVFRKAGFSLKEVTGPSIIPLPTAVAVVKELLKPAPVINIGVAPYARHPLKRWPEEYMVSLLNKISSVCKARFLLFGGHEESGKLGSIRDKVSGSEVVADRYTLYEELALMSLLDFMISMDTSNMHMSALTGTKVISIWGATDPVTGFGAWQQPDEYSIRIPYTELTCRPCTVYGKGTCRRGDHACMHWLTPEMVLVKILKSGLCRKPDEGRNTS